MNQTFYIIPSPYDAQHHGVLGMKWGVRRYQPYSVVPRGSGKGGEEVGEAARYGRDDMKAAKKNINAAFKNAKKSYTTLDKFNKKVNKAVKNPNEKGEAHVNTNVKELNKVAEARKTFDEAVNQLDSAKAVLGTSEYNRLLQNAMSIDSLKGWMLGGVLSIPNVIKNDKVRNELNEEVYKKELAREGWRSTTIKDEKGKSSYEITAMTDDVSDDYFKKAAKDFSSKKDVIKNYAMEAIMEDPYIYNSWAKDLGMSKDQFKNSLDIKSVYITENGNAEVSVWEKDDSTDILGGHSLDMEFNLYNPKKPKYVSMNG